MQHDKPEHDTKQPKDGEVFVEDPVYEDAEHTRWVCDQLAAFAEARWSQIEGIHRRAAYALTVTFGMAAFVASAIAPLQGGRAILFVTAVVLPVLTGIPAVLMPREEILFDPENLWGPAHFECDPDANSHSAANELLLFAKRRQKHVDDKGRWLVATLAATLVSTAIFLGLLAFGKAG